jgi:hypothetical protein
MNGSTPLPTSGTASDRVGHIPFDVLRYDLQRSQIVCNTLDALFRRSEGLCLPSEASSLRDFLRSDMRRIYEIWSVDVIALMAQIKSEDREAQSLIATLQGELAPLREMATGLEAALDRFCETPTATAKRSIAELVTRFCPAHRGLVDWLQVGVLSWLAKRLDLAKRQVLAAAIERRPDDEPDTIRGPHTP